MSLAVFDLDGTLLKGNSSFSFCRYLCKIDVLSSADLFYCASLYTCHLLFGLSLWSLHSRVFKRLFRGKSIASLMEHIEPFIKTLEWYEPALIRLNELSSKSTEIHIFSSSPAFLVKPIAETIGVKNVKATEYEIDNSGLLWNIATLVDGEKKKNMLLRLGKETIAFSDSHHDFLFLESASQAVAVNPNRKLAKIARSKSWEIL